MKKQSGFTLVEIAIVMVIIGLLLGGVLKGQQIITNAKIKNLENDFNGVTAAIYSYQDRYRALPGDDKRADKRFTGVTQKGDGQGDIRGNFDAINDDESRYFWLHLRNAGLVAGETDENEDASKDQPLNAFNGKTGVSSVSVTNVNISGIYVGFSQIPRDVAIIIESRSDDNKPNGGSVQTDKTSTDYTTIMDKEIDMYFAL
ncbi:prepilin-type N-terminal cleavage/methylation domain-containing protein [Candidatus Parabeggiatoa sp. HSG14]|uniref:prepilin-type N-terminal cleavage/methylation domain-containing protein n=1 Tax=Candidatus Parabeggiatoa sp. HSG14 TaxID=3055593 RepID=UPI0025A924CC|nr:prepilin-type N-terminal cleavage/methylation domain-containing protein [Thiotrichales bacterium HSG14]